MPQPALANGFMLALETIRTHKLRAFLTVLGVIVGTGTIIGVGAILTGFATARDRRPWRTARDECRYRIQQRFRHSLDRRPISCAALPTSAFTAARRGAGKPSD